MEVIRTNKNSEEADMEAAVGSEWRSALKSTITGCRSYYQDETVQMLMAKLEHLLNTKVCASADGQLVEEMWKSANSEERKAIARLFLKIADRL
jgi:hypothetical protein